MIAFRYADYDTPLRTEPASRPGRFHRGTESLPTQYLCLHPLGPLAELMRGSDLRRPEQVRAVAARTWALEIVPTYLGAHGVPPDQDPDTYVQWVCEEAIPAVASRGLARFCDV